MEAGSDLAESVAPGHAFERRVRERARGVQTLRNRGSRRDYEDRHRRGGRTKGGKAHAAISVFCSNGVGVSKVASRGGEFGATRTR